MSDGSTTDDDEVEEMDLPSWVREAASRCPGLVSEASLAKRKREQEQLTTFEPAKQAHALNRLLQSLLARRVQCALAMLSASPRAGSLA